MGKQLPAIPVSKTLEKLLGILEDHGHEGYLVGGMVRDWLMMNLRPESEVLWTATDYDITTNALPHEVMKIFADYKVVPTGITHGTVTVIIDGEPFEITTYRTEKGYSDNRHPDQVEFTSALTADLARRDFTMNSIAYNPKKGYVDPFSGVLDIENGIIRAVGNPETRFGEDALRILRGLRFYSTLGFKVEEETWKAMLKCRRQLRFISVERFYQELLKLVVGKNFYAALKDGVEIIGVQIPELLLLVDFDQKNPYHIYDVWVHTLHTMEGVDPDPLLRMTMLLHDIGKPACYTMDEKGIGHFYTHPQKGAEIAEEILRRLKVDNKSREQISTLIYYHYVSLQLNKKGVKRLLGKIGEETFRLLLKVRKADDQAKSPKYRDEFADVQVLANLLDEIIKDKECFSLDQLAISGKDLLLMGVPASKAIGEILNQLLEEVITGEIKNETEVLVWRSKALYFTH